LRIRSILADDRQASAASLLWRVAASLLLIASTSALMPCVHLLFSAEHGRTDAFRAMTSGASVTGSTSPRKRPLRTRKLNAPQDSNLISSEVTADGSQSEAMDLQHDPRLAAAHRAALNVLTESSGFDDDSSPSQARTATANPGSDPTHPKESSPSWTGAAMGAAQQLGSMAGGMGRDHDHDRH
jgi:hypothetical protein